MFWVVQKDLYFENRRTDLENTLIRFDIPHQLVSVSDYEITPDIDHDGPIITNGSIMLSKIAQRRGWQPGSLFNDNFSYEVWQPILKEWLLNRDGEIVPLRDAVINQPMFVRPVLDTKEFTGKIMTPEELEQMKVSTVHEQWTTDVLISKPKPIGQEHRHYIVNKKVVSSSRYKLGGKTNYTEGADPDVISFVERVVKVWQPADAFVLDTYTTDNEIGIVEIGCICHAGLYQSDIQKIVMALENLY